MSETKCKRCSDCANSEHHWIDNDFFGDFDDPEPDSDPRYSHVCKHCDAVGSECPDCDGAGGDLYDTDFEWECERCKGEGVVLGLAALDDDGEPLGGER